MKRLGCPRTTRLCKKGDIDRVFKAGRFVRGRKLTVGICPNGLSTIRLGIILGKQRSRTNVKRNQTRRLVRELFRLSYPRLHAGFDLIALPRQARTKGDYHEWREEWERLLKKGKVWVKT